MEAFIDQFTATELLSYKEVLDEEATEEWYAQPDTDEVDREAQQFCHLMGEYRERFFIYVLFQSPTRSIAAYLESYLLHIYYRSQLDNIYGDKEIDQLELDWITWQSDYAQNKTCGDSRTNILEAMQCKL